jgi:hypothetical protein
MLLLSRFSFSVKNSPVGTYSKDLPLQKLCNFVASEVKFGQNTHDGKKNNVLVKTTHF